MPESMTLLGYLVTDIRRYTSTKQQIDSQETAIELLANAGYGPDDEDTEFLQTLLSSAFMVSPRLERTAFQIVNDQDSINLRAYNLWPGAVFLAPDTGYVRIVRSIERDHDTEQVIVRSRAADTDYPPLFRLHAFDYNQVVVVKGNCVNPLDVDDNDFGTGYRQ